MKLHIRLNEQHSAYDWLAKQADKLGHQLTQVEIQINLTYPSTGKPCQVYVD